MPLIVQRALLFALAAFLLNLVGNTVLASTPSQADLVTLYHQHVLEINRGDLTAVMADYASDATFIAPGTGPCAASAPCVGADAIRPLWQGLIANHLQAGIISLQASGNTVTGSLNTIADSQRAAGFGVLRIKVAVAYANDKIARDVVEYDVSDPATAGYLNFVRQGGILRAYYEALNRSDTEGALTFFSEDAVVSFTPLCPAPNPCVGKVAARRAITSEVTAGIRFSPVSVVRLSDDSISARLEQRSAFHEAAGVERTISLDNVTFQGDAISRFLRDADLRDAQTASFIAFQRLAGLQLRQLDFLRRAEVAAALATFTDDAVFEGYGLCARPCPGKAAIQRELQRQVTDQTDIRRVLGSVKVTGDMITAGITISSNWIKAAGVERILGSLTQEVRGD